MTQPAVACFCVQAGIHAALYAGGPHAAERIAEFREAHNGPGHLEEQPPRDWYGKEAALARRLQQLGRGIA